MKECTWDHNSRTRFMTEGSFNRGITLLNNINCYEEKFYCIWPQTLVERFEIFFMFRVLCLPTYFLARLPLAVRDATLCLQAILFLLKY